MSDTGRIRQPLRDPLRKLLLHPSSARDTVEELQRLADIDRAQILMLCRLELMDTQAGRRVLDVIEEAEKSRFNEFLERDHVRGIYLSWESWICDRVGARIGGSIHLGRSRNDIKATDFRLKLRRPVAEVVAEATRLTRTLLRRAEENVEVVTVAYTHMRPALPVTVAHQLTAWAEAWCRDVDALIAATRDLDRCPLGAGAVAGTSVPIDPRFTADLLGFRETFRNSIDAVASRDVVLRLLSALSVMAVTLSRISAELQLLTLDEVGLFQLPDDLVGSSSQMPQKRNPFLLEHGQSRGMSAVGAFVTSASRMHATPFTNSIAVGTEGVRGITEPLNDVRETVLILRHLVDGMRPQPEKMLQAADSSFVIATELANRLVRDGCVSFREAHHIVGDLTNQSVILERPLIDLFSDYVAQESLSVDLSDLDPVGVVLKTRYGCGPSPECVSRQIDELRRCARAHRDYLRDTRKRYRVARRKLLNLSQTLGRGRSVSGTPLSQPRQTTERKEP